MQAPLRTEGLVEVRLHQVPWLTLDTGQSAGACSWGDRQRTRGDGRQGGTCRPGQRWGEAPGHAGAGPSSEDVALG